MEVPEESFHWSSWDSRTCYPQRAFIQGLTDDSLYLSLKIKGERLTHGSLSGDKRGSGIPRKTELQLKKRFFAPKLGERGLNSPLPPPFLLFGQLFVLGPND